MATVAWTAVSAVAALSGTAFAQFADPAVSGANFVPNSIQQGQTSTLSISFSNTGSGYLFASTTPIPAGGRSRIVISSQADVAGTKANITVNIVALSGGETRTNNNAVVLAQSVQR
jgi:hypothetical protein